MAERVILHVGAPKTGTSFLQDLLFTEREALKKRGILYPAEEFDSHFRAALDLMQLPWGGLEWEANGTWDRLAAQTRAWPGTVVISHEILATASRAHVAKALASLSDAPAREVHLLYSARDLVRQIPAEWQENIKHRRTTPYAEFLEQLMDPKRSEEVAQWFFGVQEIPDVLDRWGARLPKEHVHLLTVPPPGSPRDLLWQRFAGVLGIDPAEFTPQYGRANTSLGVPEVAMLRLLNEQVEDIVWNHNYRPLVREYLVHRTLSHDSDSPRLAVPPEVWRWARGRSRSWVTELALRAYDVVGDLDDLLPTEPARPFVDPDQAEPEQVAAVAIRALAAMTKEAARLRESEERLEGDVAELIRQLDAAHSTRIYQTKERLVAKAGSSRTAAAGLAVYRRLRRRRG